MSSDRPDRYSVKPEIAEGAHVTGEDYRRLYAESVADPEGFWRRQARRIEWIRPPSQIGDWSFERDDLHIRWYADGSLNVCANCVDRHLPQRADQAAIIWEGDDPGDHEIITYADLHERVCRFANVLKDLGIGKGDRVMIYLPMIPEAAVAMLACARIGAVHSVVFAGFSPGALAGRIEDCGARLVITADEGVRGGKRIGLKRNVDRALEREGTRSIEHVLVVRRTGSAIDFDPSRDVWLHKALESADAEAPPESMNAEDPLFILYTSGSTGKPKGVLHTSGGYLVYAGLTHQVVFDYHDGDVYWCTADVGWITGHSYIVYGPLANGATTLMFEGVPNFPDHSRFWRVVDKHRVNIFYTAPTAIRALMREGREPVEATSRQSLRILGTVGEPINPEAWRWYHDVVGGGRCAVVDTWWQTETGGIMISPLPGAVAPKPGAAMTPFFGVRPALLDDEGDPVEGAGSGNLVITASWPGQMRGIHGDHQRFIDTYFSQFDGVYCTGDGAERDADGDYRITGRVDDVLNVSGHRLGTAELESALVAHQAVAEAAVVGVPHEVKGEAIHAFVILAGGVEGSEGLREELVQAVREDIGPIATPENLVFAPGLPKTRSGKIMRRILRKIAAGETEDLGDTSTLADPEVVEQLIAAV